MNYQTILLKSFNAEGKANYKTLESGDTVIFKNNIPFDALVALETKEYYEKAHEEQSIMGDDSWKERCPNGKNNYIEINFVDEDCTSVFKIKSETDDIIRLEFVT